MRKWSNWNDNVNGMFEGLGGLFLTLHVARLLQDKAVAGVDYRAVAFFTAWGVWNLVYYRSLRQKWSLLASGFTALVNMTWLLLLLYYQ